jgi:nucleoside phosphorylase
MHHSRETYDVFLCHNSADKPVVRQLRDALKERQVRTWFDEDQLIPGRPWQEALEQAIKSIGAAAICVGASGFGPWQNQEMRAYIQQFVNRTAAVIPVLLPDVTQVPELPVFLQEFTWVDLRDGLSGNGLHRLICGIRGTPPGETPMIAHLNPLSSSVRQPKKARSRNPAKDDFDRPKPVVSLAESTAIRLGEGESVATTSLESRNDDVLTSNSDISCELAPCVEFATLRETGVKPEEFRAAVSDRPLLVMTAVKVEFEAVRSLMQPLPDRDCLVLCYNGQETYYGGFLGQYRVVLTMCGMGASSRDGVIGAAIDAVDHFKPGAVIMIGMGFGADPSKQRLGDVMVASQVIAYELSRVGQKLTISRGSHSEAGPILLNRLRHADVNWNHRVIDGVVQVQFGAILSGEKLIDNHAFKSRLLKKFPKAIGGDMEAAGLYAAAARKKVEWIVVKGIADWADGTKTKQWQPFAALAAATFVENMLQDPLSLAELCPPCVLGQLRGRAETLGASALHEAEVVREKEDQSQRTAQAAERARFILVDALQTVCRDLNSDQAPFPSLREGVQRDLAKEQRLDTSLSPHSLEQLLKNQLMTLMSCLSRWLDKQRELDQLERLREIIDVFAAAGMDRTWIEEMKARLLDAPHIEAPTWTDLHLCEPLLTALFGEAATWTQHRNLNHDFIQVETPGTDPESRKLMIRRNLAARHFGHHLERRSGESDAAYEDRLGELIDERLPIILAFHRKGGKPYFVLYDESATPLKTEMERDKPLWDQILKIERRRDRDGVIFEDVELGESLREMFAKLDELTKRKMGGNL